MTCIVGYVDKENNRVVIGANSASISDSSVIIRKDPKVFKNGEFIIGCTTSFRMMQLLRFSFKPPKVKSKDIYEYMCTDFITAVRHCFKEGGYIEQNENGGDIGGKFLVGYKDRLFIIDDDFQVGESIDLYLSIGCGSDFALGSLFTNRDISSVISKITKALETASYFAVGITPPFIIEHS